MNTSSCIYSELIELIQQHPGCVLATVVSTQGSTPQKAGSKALIGASGLLTGTVGGGMTELKVIQESQNLLKSKKSGIFSFDLHGELSKGNDSICGGSMVVLLEAVPEEHLAVFSQLKKSLDEHISGVLMTWVDDSKRIRRYWLLDKERTALPKELTKIVDPVISELLESHNVASFQEIHITNLENSPADFVFLECLIPKPTLIIAGAGHIGRSLAHLGRFLGFEVTVWDDRTEYASKAQIPDADFVLSGFIDSVMEQIKIRNDTYLVIVTRGHKSDAEVLRKFIAKPCAYIGMIGSKAKVSQMKTAFLENGWASAEQWARIFTPVGLDIGAQTVEEIAVSIAAQMVKVRNQRKKNYE